jgi:hypothetical protein
MKTPRSAAFTPLHHPNCQRRRIIPHAPERRALKRHECRAPLVDRLLAAKQRDAEADTSAWEREIDQLVYALYGLTPEEKALVQAVTK